MQQNAKAGMLTDKVLAIGLVIWLLFFGGFGQIKQWTSAGKPADVVRTIGQGAQQVLATAQVAVPTAARIATPVQRTTAPAQRPIAAPAAAPAAAPTLALPLQPTAAPVEQPAQEINVAVYEKPAERQPAGDIVPVNDGVIAGIDPVNIQETHECKHGQVWTDAGCKNPPSDKGNKAQP